MKYSTFKRVVVGSNSYKRCTYDRKFYYSDWEIANI